MNRTHVHKLVSGLGALLLGVILCVSTVGSASAASPQLAAAAAPSCSSAVYGWSSSVNYTFTAANGWCIYNSGHKVVFQTDGNLVYYKAGQSGSVWNSHTNGHSTATLKFQSDGNMVIYQGSTPLWTSSTSGNCSGSFRAALDYYNFGGGSEYIYFNVRGCSSTTIASATL